MRLEVNRPQVTGGVAAARAFAGRVEVLLSDMLATHVAELVERLGGLRQAAGSDLAWLAFQRLFQALAVAVELAHNLLL